MVLIAEKKYACEACIKGHRASVCQHSDRPLYEIKRKGRPVSQCDHCRELRKSKQVHVKCMCALSRDEGYASSSACDCDRTGVCHCCTTRTPYSGRKPKTREPKACDSSSNSERGNSAEAQPMGSASLEDAAHQHSHRPLLPRPPEPHPQALSHEIPPIWHTYGSHHELNPQPEFHEPNCCAHAGPHEQMQPIGGHAPQYAPAAPPAPNISAHPASYPYDELTASTAELDGWLSAFDSSQSAAPAPAQPWSGDNISLCGCGEECGCSGCPEHGGGIAPNSSASSMSCAGPNDCPSCLECILASAPLPPEQRFSSGDNPGLGGQEAGSFDLHSFGVQTQLGLHPASSLVMPGAM
ncbi:copper fist DNA binding domain-containing protein [Fomitopsis serialis]|uniref:copper fist DNA binding domain-containing protein n=1 Tax=Fomitopsis serialis TaxID=139415 RepID=UPI0020073AC7|nr:copper fist DNA binding domain-containing protein [Neoantrodia serialis]KAH9931934.1 copper fist DNA binding domain-containing protein [Neoantrodia serialis]